LKGTAKRITVSEKNGKWYISIQTEEIIEDPVHPMKETDPVGMDLGIKKLATFSDGRTIPPIDALRSCEEKIARLQRELSRRVKYSKNWYKTKDKIAKLHEKIANIRRDYIHKETVKISKTHAIVFAEDLRISNMSKSAKGTVDEPGSNVKAKSGLNKAILDQGWGELLRQLSYKLRWGGGLLLLVSPMNTSRTCSSCGYVSPENRKSQAVFLCVECGHSTDADLNASINIKEKGLLLHEQTLILWRQGMPLLVCGGDDVLSPVKQKPTRAA
jgi:putative transposase